MQQQASMQRQASTKHIDLLEMLDLFCAAVVEDSMRIVIMTTDQDPDDGLPVIQPGGEAFACHTQPVLLGTLALVSKRCHENVAKYRRKLVLAGVAYLHNCARDTVLQLCNIHQYGEYESMPSETGMVFSVLLGGRSMHTFAFCRSTLEPEPEPGTHQLTCTSAGPVDENGDPAWVTPEHDIPLHPLCWVDTLDWSRAQHGEFGLWHATASAALDAWLEAQLPALHQALAAHPALH